MQQKSGNEVTKNLHYINLYHSEETNTHHLWSLLCHKPTSHKSWIVKLYLIFWDLKKINFCYSTERLLSAKILTVVSVCLRPEDGRTMKPICLLQLCRIGVIIYDWLDIPWLKAYYNFGFDHFNISWKKVGVWGLVDCLLGNSGPFASDDWILPDLTIQGSLRLNSHLHSFPNTYYFSYATKRTKKILGVTVPSSIFGIHPLLFIRVLQMSQWRHPPDVSSPYKGYRCVFKCILCFGFLSISSFTTIHILHVVTQALCE